MEGVVPTYALKDNCPNWEAALATARRQMGCDASSTPPSAACQKQLPCDICQFLQEGAWPPAFVVEYPAELRENNVYGAVLWDPRWMERCPIGDKTRAEFKQALCFGKGLWGFDKVETLAKTQVHEALHLCKAVGGRGSSTRDKKFWDYLLCPAADTAEVVELCWQPRG
jgi:hypothetical protein